MRCFVAMSPGGAIKDAVGETVGELRTAAAAAGVRVSWTRPEGWHVTFKFLGEITAAEADKVKVALAETLRGIRAFTVTVAGLLALPGRGAPRVLAAGIADDGSSARIAARIEDALLPLGFDAERRPFRAHLTLGRVRSPKGTRALVQAMQPMTERSFGETEIADVTLYRSELREGGARYTPLASFELAAA